MESIWAMPNWKWLDVCPITVDTFLLLKARPCRGSWAQGDFLFHLHNLP